MTPTTVIGWREWVGLPDLGASWIKAKSDTGARSSSLHAFDLEHFTRDDAPWVRFEIHPWQRSKADAVVAEAPLADQRVVKSSSGSGQRRAVIRTTLALGGLRYPIDLTLTRRDEMGFRMLLGREAMRRRVVVDPGSSYKLGRPPLEVRRSNRAPEEDDVLDEVGE